jgi:hypothetical protein
LIAADETVKIGKRKRTPSHPQKESGYPDEPRTMSLQEKRQPPLGSPQDGQDARPGGADRAELQKTAFAVYSRDLPALLDEHAGKWVAYHGAERLGIADDDTDLYELGRQRGLSPQSLLVIGIDPEGDQVPVLSESEFPSREPAEAGDSV